MDTGIGGSSSLTQIPALTNGTGEPMAIAPEDAPAAAGAAGGAGAAPAGGRGGRGGGRGEAAAVPAPARGASAQPSPQFNLVHDVRVSNDDLVYVADRNNNRIQIFSLDGKFQKEVFIARETSTSNGTVYSIAFSVDPAQRFLYVADAGNGRIRILNRQTNGSTWFDRQMGPSTRAVHGAPRHRGRFERATSMSARSAKATSRSSC